jgi:hypothetical protein
MALLSSGPGGNRTRVRKPLPQSISHHSHSFWNSLGRAANGLLSASVASSYARCLKALAVSFPMIMTPVSGSIGTTGPTSGT